MRDAVVETSPTFVPHDTEAVWDLDEHRSVFIDSNLVQVIHRSVPWPGTGHPEAMKMSCRQGYFYISA